LAAKAQAMRSGIVEELGQKAGAFGLVTLHRPSNVDDPAALKALLDVLDEVSREMPLVFPVHPRTRARLSTMGVCLNGGRWHVTDPLGYLDFLKLQASARVVFTDSGGVQEETTVLGVPCVTLRTSTERPVTISEGTNVLAGTDRASVLASLQQALERRRDGRTPRFWDGRAADRVVEALHQTFAR
jgi:UDP-N-acetylglucosamine 2-epimerase (non-hydrolysing)